MSSMTLFFESIGVLYFLFGCILFVGWIRIPARSEIHTQENIRISVVVACRNEESNIEELLESIRRQNYPTSLFDVTVVDDSSEDKTKEVIKAFSAKSGFAIRLIEMTPDSLSKKKALAAGISATSGEWIVTTDADCIAGRDWLTSIANAIANDQADFLIGPVCMHSERSFLEKLQSLEFMGLTGSSGSFAGIGLPILCNGANLAFRRSIYNDVGGYKKHEHISSGDDMLFMQEVNSHGGRIAFLKHESAIISTRAESSISKFINQRVRWLSKNYRVRNLLAISTGSIVLLMNISIITCLISGAVIPALLKTGVTLFLLKSSIDFINLLQFASFYKKKHLLFLFLPAQVFVIFYPILVAGISIWSDSEWKGRRTNR